MDTHLNDLNFLLSSIRTHINSILKPISKTNSTVPVNGPKFTKKLSQIQKGLTQLYNYSLLLLKNNFKATQELNQREKDLQILKKNSSLTLKRMNGLEEQSIRLRKELNLKEKQIQNLKHLNKINVSYASSKEFKDVSGKENEQELSFDSVEGSQELNCYNSDDQEEDASSLFSQRTMRMSRRDSDGENLVGILNRMDSNEQYNINQL